MKKICKKCKIEKDIIEFTKNQNNKDRYNRYCKLCEKNRKHIDYINNQEKRKYQHKKWKLNNPEYYKQWRLDILEKYKENHKQWKIKNPTYKKEYYLKNPHYNRDYERRKCQTDLMFRIKRNLRTRIRMALINIQKFGRTLELLGCTGEEFRQYLESKFTEGMSWDNYGNKTGQWSIDHIIPCSIFDLIDPIEQKQCFHYSNCQPMWHSDNMKKGNRIT